MSAIVAALGPFDEELGKRMLERMRHRGPDGTGWRSGGDVWLGTQRLAIMDPDPEAMTELRDGDERLWLVGDGEIFNHRRLQAQLGGVGGGSDLDTVLRLFREHGLGAFAQLWGTFALVIASADGRFVAARDALGIAPLYWARRGDTVLFASELKAFDEEWLADVEPFPPGHVWTPRDGLVAGPAMPGSGPVLLRGMAGDDAPPEWVFEAVRDSLVRAVERNLVAGVPIGILLSGGVDSSIIAAIAARAMERRGERLPSFSVGMAGSNDLVAARTVAEHVGTDHHELVYTAEDAIALVPEIVAELESFDPTLVHSAVPHHLVATLAAQHVKVVLAGEGADELFAGYTHFGEVDTGTALQSELIETLEGMHIGGLQRVDRIAAARGIEPRMPFLDLDVVELAMALPPEWKLLGEGRPAKWLLRRAFDGWLPDEVLWRRKEQFGQGTGMDAVLREHFGALCSEEDLQREASRLDPPIRTREELAYYRMFVEALPGVDAARNVGRFVEA